MSRLQRGFTLLEALLSIGFISVLSGLSLPIYQSFVNRTDLDVTAQSVADMLRRAQVYSRGVSGDSQWGVKIEPSAATLFKGGTFAGHDASFDEVTAIPSSMGLSGSLDEVVFSKLSGAPTPTPAPTYTLTLMTLNNETRTITINAKGMVNY